MTASLPDLSVVLITPHSFETIHRTVRHLCAQTLASRIELLLCVPSAGGFDLDRDAVAPLHSTRILEVGEVTKSGPARARAARQASAPVVVYAEDHCFPEPGWAEALLSAHHGPHAAVGPAFRNANPETAVSWADFILGYSRWMVPGRAGVVPLLPGHNSSYKCQVLRAYGSDLDDFMEAETVLFWDLRRRGQTLYFEPAAITAHMNFEKLSVWLSVTWHLGRVFAAKRVREWAWPRRLAYGCAAPLIPLIRLSHLVKSLGRNRVNVRHIARGLPAIALALIVDTIAQATGAISGPGASALRLTAYDYLRERHRV
jgi:hypothetical protein